MNPELNGPSDNSIEKAEKKDNAIVNAFGGLSTREKVMVYGLVIVVIVAVLGFFVIIPTLDKLSTLQEDVDGLIDQQANYQMQISQTPAFKQQYEEASANLKKYETFFYSVMQPETIDKTITSLVRKVGMRPQSLTLSQLEQVDVPRFSPQSLNGEGGSFTDGSVLGGTGAADSDADPNATGEVENSEEAYSEEEGYENEMSGGTTAYAYTVDVTALADQEQLFELIDAVQKMTALELVSYDLTPPKEEVINPGDILVGTPTQVAESGSISLKFKIYVYIPGQSFTSPEDGEQ